MAEWIKTGSIVDMLEESEVCAFDIKEDRVYVNAQDASVALYPEMLRHLAGELNQMADELEDE